ncbi:hypothetical protein BT63DRAFT_471822 [Microthyrium microscopicum]|uniref:Uncharacterized protein n=1 Tax=Microthyrium microscopicum TaxID=703497 RepID=A0A6A6U9V0_9PEZI|nr:hypothetical protein BT63DRAFT_471822 [Microthyrium microscopicum]
MAHLSGNISQGRRGSLPTLDKRNSSNRLTMASINDEARYRAIADYLYSKISAQNWFSPSVPGSPRGVLLRKAREKYETQPRTIDSMLGAAVLKMNVGCAFTMSTQTTLVIGSTLQTYETEISLPDGSQVQVIDSLADIVESGTGFVKKFQYCAYLRQEQFLLVWHDDLECILQKAMEIEDKLLGLIWGSTASPFALNTPPLSKQNSAYPSTVYLPLDTKGQPGVSETELPLEESDEEAATASQESLSRPLVFTSSINTGMGMFLILVLILGLGVSSLVFESMMDGNYIRYALIATIPLFIIFSMFFCIVLVSDLFRAFGPITSMRTNSRFFSAVAPNYKKAIATGMSPPHITIQMPVYKESLDGVIIPTLRSLKKAISHYECHGGTASVFINDDGMAFLSEEEQKERINFYHDNNVGWVSRPKHGEDGYQRKGKFKKASNMNFCLNISCQVEQILRKFVDQKMQSEKAEAAFFDSREEESLYQDALEQVLEGDKRAKAGGNIRVGEFILIVDSDTLVPEDCLIYGAAEMFFSPEVAIIQHATGVMQVQHDYFENGISFFTNLIYSAIRFAVGNGEVAPFVGHNAFLRWKAVQSVGRVEEGGYIAYWSEAHVSEDFDIALRLQIEGSIVRLATYQNNEFKEGVSLTIYDELNRWEKYAYGCNELVFNPIWTWLWRGPFTKLFITFLRSDMHLSSKITVLGYISSYYALASSFPLTILNYFLTGWIIDELDKFYLPSWQVFLSVVLVFSFSGNVTLAIMRYRLKEKALWASLVENFKWMPFFSIFFGGLSFHLNLALLSHMFGIDMQWGATQKEVENSNFFMEMPKIWQRFKWMYAIVIPMFGCMIYLGCFAPRGWEINQVVSIVPLAVMLASHALVPFVLNPSVMVFNY